MEAHKYQEYRYKIDYRILEEIWGETTGNLENETLQKYFDFKTEVYMDYFLMLDDRGVIDNPDGCYYFNDTEELVFPEDSEEDKKMVRREIEKHKMPADTKLD